MIVREATAADTAELLLVEKQAFDEDEESQLVERLLADPTARPLLSLVAVNDTQMVGHILFTSVRLSNSGHSIPSSILAPLAVIPAAQGRGVGGELINAGLSLISESGVELVFVLGYPDYYSRFGFRPAGEVGFEAPYPIAEEHADAWMVRELCSGIIGDVSGKVICADALDQPELWQE